MLDPIDPKPNFPQLEEEILKFWKDNQIFEKSVEIRKNADPFVFYEGPPTANAKPGLHHVLARVFKDLFPRFWTMRGKQVLRKAGWDTHGLPVEIQVEKKLGISGKKEIESLKPTIEESIEYFNKECRELVWQDIQDWKELTERIGYWLDLDHPYITYETEYIENLWLIIKKIWDKKLLYQSFKVLPYCPRCGTPLSSHEVAQGYKDVTEDSAYVLFEKANEPGTYFMSWTTTPWTLPGNVGLAVAPEVKYVQISHKGKKIILAEARLKVITGEYKIEKFFLGKELVGERYQPLYDVIPQDISGVRYEVIPADFVTTEDGSGIVHTAVMYGEEDYQLGEKVGLPKFHTVDATGKFIDQVEKFAGQFVKDAEKNIIKDLKERALLYEVEAYTHSYPFCWRCSSPLLYYARESWFIAMSKLRSELVEENSKINWVPTHIKEGRFGEFLKEAKDWAFSRERYWGTPLPIWRCPDCKKELCFGSLEEIKNQGGDLSLLGDEANPHRPFIDRITIPCQCGGKMKREPYVIDVWFDSGAMPFASGESKAGRYPADYICEAIDQTRGWFYTLLAIGLLEDQGIPYKNVICLGHINDDNGQKMSKSKGNIINPWDIANKYGIDALRIYFYSVNQPGETKQFTVKDLENTMRKSIILLWNIYSFFLTYAKVDNFQTSSRKVESQNILDLWLKAKFDQFNKTLTEKLEKYDVFFASRLHIEFLEEWSTWYLRRSRERRDNSFYQAMYDILLKYVKTLAPLAPFVSEKIYQNLRNETMPISVHLCDWLETDSYDLKIIESMNLVKSLVETAHSQRSSYGLKLRQPLKKATINQKFILEEELLNILKDEINVEVIEKGEVPDVIIDKELTPELIQKGIARDFLRLVQNERKNKNLKPGDPARLVFPTSDKLELKKILSIIKSELSSKASIVKTEARYNIAQGQILILPNKKTISFTIEAINQ